MDELDETRDLINKLRQDRAKLGDTSKADIKPVRLPRVSSRKPSIVLLLYTFILGALSTHALSNEYAYFACFMFVLVAWLYTVLKE